MDRDILLTLAKALIVALLDEEISYSRYIQAQTWVGSELMKLDDD